MRHRNLFTILIVCAVLGTSCTVNRGELNKMIRRGNSAYLVVSAQASIVKTIYVEVSRNSMKVSYLSFDYDSVMISLRAGDFFFADISPDGRLINIGISFRARGIRKEVVNRLKQEQVLALRDSEEMADLQRRLDRSLTREAIFGGSDPDVLQGMIDAIRDKRAGWDR